MATAGQATCHADSGGPLVYHFEGIPILIGVVSFGSAIGCETNNREINELQIEFENQQNLFLADGYARITSFIDWIDETIPITHL